MREHFFQKIDDIKHDILRMGNMVERIINDSVNALKNQDVEASKRIYIDDDKIDTMEHEIENKCVSLLALQQPLAKDLRVITTALRIIIDLERMGDHAVNIAKTTIEIGNEPFIKPLVDIPKMADITQEMVKLSLDAFVKEDINLAKKVAEMDEEVDKLYELVIKDLLSIIAKDSSSMNQAAKLMFVGRFLERIADHTTNICERIIYMVTGEYEEIN
ncbi:phosphate uptake regulator, PhoU [Caloramator quimbayensis]|uniref:Phosphate-specific transport system accessory protein PhoU n=1 Tax=Caloramator quimbayensis TaxID=1147123 RepID=A0A1T4Y311_9CLOT|nr:phosphate signaling complex protein PhoU [Caloramator quimbayensis]SKA96182.1 phosphate uptake regulator, PhoU [Caloramator quimbayensis]